MNKYILLFVFLISGNCWANTCSTPNSSYTYISGTTILPNQVQTNENNIYTYLQSGVCNYQVGSISQAAISSTAGILYSQLNLSGGILPGDINTSTTTSVYQFENITVPYNATITGTFNVGSEHTGDILYDNGTSFVRLVPSIYGQVLTSQGTTTAPIYSYPSGQLGTWANSSNTNTVYNPTTDLFVTARCSPTSSNSVINGYTDGNSSPSTIVVYQGIGAASGGNLGITFPVKKNQYWEITLSNCGTTQIYTIPLGS